MAGNFGIKGKQHVQGGSGTPVSGGTGTPVGGSREVKGGDPSIFDSKSVDANWKDADTDKDGYLSQDELYSQAQREMKELYPDQDLIYDSDNNLTAEGVKLLNSMMNDDIFKSMDKDGNGSIDRGEYDKYMASLTPKNVQDEPNGDEYDKLLDRLKSYADGYSDQDPSEDGYSEEGDIDAD